MFDVLHTPVEFADDDDDGGLSGDESEHKHDEGHDHTHGMAELGSAVMVVMPHASDPAIRVRVVDPSVRSLFAAVQHQKHVLSSSSSGVQTGRA